jgi:hypothetical protein
MAGIHISRLVHFTCSTAAVRTGSIWNGMILYTVSLAES